MNDICCTRGGEALVQFFDKFRLVLKGNESTGSRVEDSTHIESDNGQHGFLDDHSKRLEHRPM